MSLRLQVFDHRESPYERPTQAWICGHAADGRPCRLGPDRHGQCRTLFECEPVRRDDRWHCTRPASAGGPCAGGPRPDGACCREITPCVPAASWRRRRAVAGRWMALVTLGVLILVFGSRRWTRSLVPGPMSLEHAGIDDCGACHSAAARGPEHWVQAAVESEGVEVDSDRCLVCHFMSVRPLEPHNQPPEALAALAPSAPSKSLRFVVGDTILPPSSESRDLVACASCHTEHHGPRASLTRLDDHACQACHQVQFDRFSEDHPAFGRYPFQHRPSLVFDHAGHIRKHFPDAEARLGSSLAPTVCGDCHQPDARGQGILVRPFAETCAPCHAGQVDGRDRVAGTRGISVLALPGLDAETLRERGLDVGDWPDWADHDLEPFLSLLLASDPGLATGLERLEKVDLRDLRDAADGDLELAALLAWDVKRLFRDLLADGAETLARRIAAVTGKELDRATTAALSASLSHDLVEDAHEAWFPNLFEELRRHDAGEAPFAGTLRPRPPPRADKPKPAAPPSKADDNDLLGAAGDDNDLLGGAGDDNDLLGAAGDDNDLLGGGAAGGAPPPPPPPPSPPPEPTIDPESWASFGGWYRSDFALAYRPTSHADPFLHAWLDLLAGTHGSPQEPLVRDLFAALTREDAPGACGKCHSVDQIAGGALSVRWNPIRATAGRPSFTYFSHMAHFSLGQDAGCFTCHRLDEQADVLSAYQGRDPTVLASSFLVMERGLCTQCHTQGISGEACTLCHRYHVDVMRPTTLQTRLSKAGPHPQTPSP